MYDASLKEDAGYPDDTIVTRDEEGAAPEVAAAVSEEVSEARE
jgi:hypothetical protein